jgi:hypothetical protein
MAMRFSSSESDSPLVMVAPLNQGRPSIAPGPGHDQASHGAREQALEPEPDFALLNPGRGC